MPCLESTPARATTGNYPDKGLWDFLTAAAEAMNSKKSNMEVPDIIQIFYETRLACRTNGSVYLAPAYPYFLDTHLYRSRYKKKGAQVFMRLVDRWKGGTGRTIGADVFTYIRKRVEKEAFTAHKSRGTQERKLDYLLVDLRTGMTELADAAVGHLFNELVIVSGLNTQNTEGLLQALRAMNDRLKQSREGAAGTVRVTVVFSPVPNAEIDRVRKKLEAVYQDLKALKDEWDEHKAPLKLLLPPEPGPDQKAPDFHLIHYCDYLAVGDGVLIEDYPETLTTRELVEIAEEIVKPPLEKESDAEQETRSIPPDEGGEDEPLKPDPCWQWVFDLWRDVPDWRWPLELFGAEPFDESLLLNRFSEDTPDHIRDRILSGLAFSLENDRNGKIKILRELEGMEEKPLDDLVTQLAEEQSRIADAEEKKGREMALATLAAMRDWIDILETLGARFVPGAEMIRRIDSVKTVPSWGLLLVLAGMRIKHEVARSSLLTLIEEPGTPPDVVVAALKITDRSIVLENKLLMKALTNWMDQLLVHELPHAWYHNLAIIIHGQFGLYDAAERLYRKAAEGWQSKWAAYPWHSLGSLLKNHMGRYEEAEAAYRRAIELDPKDADPWTGLGNLLKNHLGQYKESETAYRRSIELNPKLAYPWTGLGNLLQDHMGRYEEAEAVYRRAIELDPNYAYPWNGLGNLLMNHMGRYVESEAA
ncbi:MAG: tetratricopeptide repeat protein, partial [Proteobacteria bacterium]|nr:tetratricopeptide repeat protein [Pseudomonadota bacterium]